MRFRRSSRVAAESRWLVRATYAGRLASSRPDPTRSSKKLLTVLPFLGLLALLSAPRLASAQEAAAASAPGKLQATSLLGRALYARAPSAEEAAAIATAERELRAAPQDVEKAIALGRAHAAVWQYTDAIAVYTEALAQSPQHAMLHRHRGHRFLSTREIGFGLQDMERAVLLEQGDFDIWYHLGLARYLKRDFTGAAEAYRSCRGTATNDDGVIAVSYWLYQALSRAGEKEAATAVLEPIREGMAVEENRAYYDLLRFYKGVITEAEALPAEGDPLELATRGYGLANWKLVRGDRDAAKAILERVVAGEFWPAFGFLASEVELAGMR